MANGRLNLADGQLPPFTPSPFSLLNTATELGELGRTWTQGLTWEPLCADAATTYSVCLVLIRDPGTPTEPTNEDIPEPPEKAETAFFEIRGATPFMAHSEIDCSPQSGSARIKARAEQALIRAEARIVEAAFWTGQAANQAVVWPHLAATSELVEDTPGGATLQEAADVVTDSPVPITTALSELEAALGTCYDGVGTIHVPAGLVPYLAANDLITVRGGQMFTTLGNKVAAGRGYPGTGPDGTATPGTSWMFATGEVFYKRGEVQPLGDRDESFDRQRNTIKAIAERPYVFGWDCCLLAAQIDLAASDPGGGGS